MRRLEDFLYAKFKPTKPFWLMRSTERRLPEKHGFPLRAVAEGYVGADWIKFVERIDAVITAPVPDEAEKNAAPVYVP